MFADGVGPGWSACLENSAAGARCEAAGRSASHVSYRNLLIKFLAAVDHLTESCGAARRGKVAVERWDAATMSRESLFPACSPWRSRPAAVIVCGIVGAVGSGAGAILQVWLVIRVIFASVIVFVWQDVFIKPTGLNEWSQSFFQFTSFINPFQESQSQFYIDGGWGVGGAISVSKVNIHLFRIHSINVFEQ